MAKPLVLIISAPSGSGKSTLVKRLIDENPNIDFSTSVTTRLPRAGEVDGESYDFVDRETFLRMRDNDELLEWAEVFGHYYGTCRKILDESSSRGHDLILDIDVQGARQLVEKLPEAITVFILPPSKKVLELRLRKRSSDPEEVIERRLRDAGKEVAGAGDYNYVLVNDKLEETFEELSSILVAERRRNERMTHKIQSIVESFREGVSE
jgi:guanylate kinase